MPNITNDTVPQSPLLTEREAAAYLKVAEASLRNSRSTKILCGTAAPKFAKFGRSVRYRRATLDAWQEQFSEYASNAEVPEAG